MVRPLPQIGLEEIFPSIEEEPINIHQYAYKTGDMPLLEMAQLCRLVKRKNPKVIFEIGTFEGNTTLHLALNSDAEVYTLDLPPDDHHPVWNAGLDVYPNQPGNRFQGTPFAQKIHSLLGDSTKFDYSPWQAKADLVFVDGCHHYEFVKQDSQTALKLLAPSGIIMWHDYASYAPGVVRALEELAGSLPLVHIAGTSMALHSANGELTERFLFEWISREALEELRICQARCPELEATSAELQTRCDELSLQLAERERALLAFLNSKTYRAGRVIGWPLRLWEQWNAHSVARAERNFEAARQRRRR